MSLPTEVRADLYRDVCSFVVALASSMMVCLKEILVTCLVCLSM